MTLSLETSKEYHKTGQFINPRHISQLEACDHTRYLLELIQYILNVDEGHTKIEDLIGTLQHNLSPDIKGGIMSLAEKLIEQGMQKGLREGELKGKFEGKLEIAERMLLEDSDPAFVEKVTSLSLTQIKKWLKT